MPVVAEIKLVIDQFAQNEAHCGAVRQAAQHWRDLGTRIEEPSSLPASAGITRPSALAAPVAVFSQGRDTRAFRPCMWAARRIGALALRWCCAPAAQPARPRQPDKT
jgi:hypothetical protein